MNIYKMAILKSINPYTEELNAEFETLWIDDVNKKIEISHKSYLLWKDSTLTYRKELFLNLANELEKDIDECANLETIEMWMLNHVSKAWLQKTVNLIRWFSENFEDILWEKEYETEWLKVKEYYDSLWVSFE